MPSVVATSQASQEGTGATLACLKPAGTASGHLLLAWHSVDTGALSTLSVSAGGAAWSTLTEIIGSNGTNNATKLYWKIASGSEPASYTFNQASNADSVATVIAISGADTNAPIYAQANDGSGASVSTPSVNAPGSADLDVRFVAVAVGLSTNEGFLPPAGFTEVADTGSRQYVYITAAYRQLSSSGATGVHSFACSTSATYRERVSVVVTSGETPKSLADSATSADTVTVDAGTSQTESAAATDAVTVTATTSSADTALASDAVTVAVALDLADSAVADDAVTTGMPVDLADTAVADDALTTVPTPVYDEQAVVSDALTVAVSGNLTDSAVASDGISVSEVLFKNLADSGAASDELQIVVLEDLEFTAKPLRRGWDAAAPARDWTGPDIEPGWTPHALTI